LPILAATAFGIAKQCATQSAHLSGTALRGVFQTELRCADRAGAVMQRLTRGDKLLRAGAHTPEKLRSKSRLLVNKLDISVRCKSLKERNIPPVV